jgi:hypothetical protein
VCGSLWADLSDFWRSQVHSERKTIKNEGDALWESWDTHIHSRRSARRI